MSSKGRRYVVGLVPLFVLVPFFSRPTYRYEVVPGRVWTLEQKQGIGLGLNTAVNVRMTCVRLGGDGGLLLHSPIAATGECVALVRDLEAVAGVPVRHIVLGTTLLEHKLWLGPLARAFPGSSVHVVEGQYAWPVDLPNGLLVTGAFLGASRRGTPLREGNAADMPWNPAGARPELVHTVFTTGPSITPLGARVAFNEAALLHVPTGTLLCTDAVMLLPRDPPDALTRRDLLESGDDGNFAIRCLSRETFRLASVSCCFIRYFSDFGI